DLRLTDDHRVEAGRDTEQMPDRLAVAMRVHALAELLVAHAVGLGDERRQRGRYGVAVAAAGDDLDTIAGGDDHALLHARLGDEPTQRGLETAVLEGDPFSHLDRRRVVAEPDEDDALPHGQNAFP